MTERWASFDCYGTLIDWMGGIRATLADIWPEHDAEILLSAYHEGEPEVQSGRARADRPAGRPADHRVRGGLVQAGTRALGALLRAERGEARAPRARCSLALPRQRAQPRARTH